MVPPEPTTVYLVANISTGGALIAVYRAAAGGWGLHTVVPGNFFMPRDGVKLVRLGAVVRASVSYARQWEGRGFEPCLRHKFCKKAGM